MAKEFGIAVGKKLKAYGYRKGISQAGKWQLFSYIEKVKDMTGTWIPAQKYQIWITNKEELNLNDGQDVEISGISKIVPTWNEYNSRSGQHIKERLINVYCELKTDVAQHTNDKGVAGSNYVRQQQANPFESTPQQESNPFASQNDDNPFANIDDDDLPY